MKKLLEKLKLIQHFLSELNLTNDEFKNILHDNVDNEKPGFLSDSFDVINRSKNNYKGIISANKFLFKYRRKLFSALLSYPLVEGVFFEENNKLKVRATINVFKGPMIVIAIAAIAGLLINVIFGTIAWQNTNPKDDIIFVNGITAMIIMIACTYTIMRVSIFILRKKISSDLFEIKPNKS